MRLENSPRRSTRSSRTGVIHPTMARKCGGRIVDKVEEVENGGYKALILCRLGQGKGGYVGHIDLSWPRLNIGLILLRRSVPLL